jgi:hypothetical protein
MKLSIAQRRKRLAKLYRNAGRNHVDAMRRLDAAAKEFSAAQKYKIKIERVEQLKSGRLEADSR